MEIRLLFRQRPPFYCWWLPWRVIFPRVGRLESILWLRFAPNDGSFIDQVNVDLGRGTGYFYRSIFPAGGGEGNMGIVCKAESFLWHPKEIPVEPMI